MASSQDKRSKESGAPSYPMVDLESGAAGYKTPVQSSSTSASPAYSPTETAYLNYTNDHERIPTRFSSGDTPTYLQCLPSLFIGPCDETLSWMKGPQTPRPYHIKPILKRVQTAPITLLNRL